MNRKRILDVAIQQLRNGLNEMLSVDDVVYSKPQPQPRTTPKPIHLVPDEGLWLVKEEGGGKEVTANYKQEARGIARKMARLNGSWIKVHDRYGRFCKV